MSVLLWVILSVAVVLGYRGWQKMRLRALRANDVRKALAHCGSLIVLIKKMQQHRGLSAGWLAGEKSFGSDMMQRRREIERVFIELEKLAEDESSQPRPVLQHNELRLLRFHWQELIEQLSGLDASKCIARHSQLIARVLDWLSALGDARVTLKLSDAEGVETAKNYADRLPRLAEYIGQARAVGSSVAAAEKLSSVDSVRLHYLVMRIESLSNFSRSEMGGGEWKTAREAVRNLLSTVQTALIGKGGVSIPAGQYFALATQALDAVYACDQACAVDLSQRIDRLVSKEMFADHARAVLG